MTLINNIPALQIPGLVAPQGAQAAGQQTPGLMGFLGLILNQADGQVLLPQNSPAPLPGLPGIQALAEKIAAAPDLAPQDKGTLLKILQQSGLSQISAAPATPVKPGLTSDLSAAVALDTQQPSAPANPLAEKIAALLNQIEPGAGQPATPETLENLKQEFIGLLQAQGVPAEKIAEYVALVFPAQPAAAPEKPAATKDAATAPKATATEALKQVLEQLQATEKRAAPQPENSVTKPVLPSSAPEKQATAAPMAPAAPPQENAPAAKPAAASHIALVNALAANDGGANADSAGYQNLFKQEGGDLLPGTLHAGKPDAANPQGFVNYLTAAGRSMPAQTLQMISLQVQRNAAAKIDTFTMQLDPADLGRLDIRMKFDDDGGVKLHLTADRAETLSMLQKDSQQLERLLQKAGLNADDASLSFDLRQQGQQREADDAQGGSRGAGPVEGLPEDTAIQAKLAVMSAGYISHTGINIMV